MEKKVICGIYLIRNTVNGKIYVGQAKNIHKRIGGHKSEANKSVMSRRASPSLWVDFREHGWDNFKFEVIEEVEESLLKVREDYWIMELKSNNPEIGYNRRRDTVDGMIVHEQTSKKIRDRLRKEWEEGLRKDHGAKLAASWSEDENRKVEQGKLFSQTLTKYVYNIYNLEGKFIKTVLYKELQEMGLKNCNATMSKDQKNKIKFKGVIVEKVLIEK